MNIFVCFDFDFFQGLCLLPYRLLNRIGVLPPPAGAGQSPDGRIGLFLGVSGAIFEVRGGLRTNGPKIWLFGIVSIGFKSPVNVAVVWDVVV